MIMKPELDPYAKSNNIINQSNYFSVYQPNQINNPLVDGANVRPYEEESKFVD